MQTLAGIKFENKDINCKIDVSHTITSTLELSTHHDEGEEPEIMIHSVRISGTDTDITDDLNEKLLSEIRALILQKLSRGGADDWRY